MADEQRPIIVKKIKKHGGGHHGGAWKIAYADFVTAMMAFFLLMWLLGSTAKGDLQGISEYFSTPLKVALQGGTGAGDASHVIKGGGKDLTRREGQVKKGDVEEQKKVINIKAANADRLRMEQIRLKELKTKIESAIEASNTLRQFKNQLMLDFTGEGLRIQIVDEKNRPMFATAQAQLESYTYEILRQIGAVLNGVPNKISLSGHTDSLAFSSGERGYSNWELSTDRANASRRELVAGGLDDGKVLRVVGLASMVPLDRDNPDAPINRRISIIVLNKKTEDAITRDAGAQRELQADSEVTSDELVPEGQKTQAGKGEPAPATERAPEGTPAGGNNRK